MRHILCFILLFIGITAFSQNVGIGVDTPHQSAKLQVSSTTSGFLPPRMTYAQRNAISNPAAGLIIWCTDCLPKGEVQVFNGTEWTNMVGGTAAVNFPSVTIGTQLWSSKNLDVATYRNGDPIPMVTDSTQWVNLTTGAWCWYNNDSATYAATYGRLYNWYAVNDPRGLAPQGWHVPTDGEWNKLVKYLDAAADTTPCILCYQSATAGGAMKETGTSHWLSPNTGATNSSGFTGLPGGFRYDNGIFFYNIGTDGYFWSSTKSGTDYAWCRLLEYENSNVLRSLYGNWRHGFSVRCLRD